MAIDKHPTGLHMFRQIIIQQVCRTALFAVCRFDAQAQSGESHKLHNSQITALSFQLTCVRHIAPHSVEETVIRLMT